MQNTFKKKLVACCVAVLVTALVLGGIGIGTYCAIDSLSDDSDNTKSHGSGIKTESTDVETSKEIPEIIKENPLPGESYDSLVELYEQCSKSCVSIICTVEYEVNYGFYKDTQIGTSLGSGFILEGEKNGNKQFYIITNHHVVEDAKSIEVKFYDSEETHKAKLIGSDSATDIAVLTIEKTDLVPLKIGDSDACKVGQWVVAIGSPMDIELEGTMTYGIISGLDRKLDITNDAGTVVKTMSVIQTSAEINPGNSGGPLLNMAGEVIGINAMKSSQEYEGLGFALPATQALNVINQIIVNGRVTDRNDSFVTSAAQLGITGATVNEQTRTTYRLSNSCPDGVLVITVNRGTAVYEAGLSIYDIITEFDGEKVTSIEQLKELIAKHNAGEKVEMTFFREARNANDKNEYITVSITLDGAQ